MIYTAIDNFYLTEEQIKTPPSRKDRIDEATEVALRFYGCDLIQEDHKQLWLLGMFYCKKSLANFDVKIVAASCVWLASKLKRQDMSSLCSTGWSAAGRTFTYIDHLDFCFPRSTLS